MPPLCSMNKQPVKYHQTDTRWGNLPYRVPGEDSTISGSGCGPTAAAMLIETITGKTFTPVDACNWSVEHGYKALNQGTYYSYFKPQFAAFGIDCDQLSWVNTYGKPAHNNHKKMLEMLKEGYYIIALMGKGLWTHSGHFVVVWWADNKIYINDPASTRQERMRGDPYTFFSQAKYYWWVDARAYNNGEDEEMNQEQFDSFMDNYIARKASEPASKWATDKTNQHPHGILEEAKAMGFTDGSRPKANATREEVAAMILAAIAGDC